MKKNYTVETLVFLNSKLDEIIGKSDLIKELLKEEEDPKILNLLDKKLEKLQEELDFIDNKIRLEQKMLKSSHGI